VDPQHGVGLEQAGHAQRSRIDRLGHRVPHDRQHNRRGLAGRGDEGIAPPLDLFPKIEAAIQIPEEGVGFRRLDFFSGRT
jgi:hypothetical protein